MTQEQFDQSSAELLALAQSIRDKKGPEYTQGNADVLAKFKATGERLRLNPLQVLGVHLDKQIAAILSFAGNPDRETAEPIETRFADALNFLLFGFGLLRERPRVTIDLARMLADSERIHRHVENGGNPSELEGIKFVKPFKVDDSALPIIPPKMSEAEKKAEKEAIVADILKRTEEGRVGFSNEAYR